MTIKDHEHDLKRLEDINLPFEDNPFFKYSQHHCQGGDCDYHVFRYLSHEPNAYNL